jgi:hypothetical protein
VEPCGYLGTEGAGFTFADVMSCVIWKENLPPFRAQDTHYVTITGPNRLMLIGETVAAYCENHTEHWVA